MRLPFIARAEHEARIADLRAALAVADARAEGAETRFATLLEKYHTLVQPEPTPRAEPVVRPPASRVQQAIRDESGGDVRLASWLRKRANELRAEGKNDEEIATELGTWDSTPTA